MKIVRIQKYFSKYLNDNEERMCGEYELGFIFLTLEFENQYLTYHSHLFYFIEPVVEE